MKQAQVLASLQRLYRQIVKGFIAWILKKIFYKKNGKKNSVIIFQFYIVKPLNLTLKMAIIN
jgi:hypothetical protein